MGDTKVAAHEFTTDETDRKHWNLIDMMIRVDDEQTLSFVSESLLGAQFAYLIILLN